MPFIVNDRVDVALAVAADGVHLGKTDMGFADAKKILGRDSIVGLSIERLSGLEKIKGYDADYLGVGALFPTTTKKDASYHWSKNDVKKLKGLTQCPLVGIGGIGVGNIDEVLKWGLDGVAVASAVLDVDSLDEVEARSGELKSALRRHYENV